MANIMKPNSNDVLFHAFRKEHSGLSPKEMDLLEARNRDSSISNSTKSETESETASTSHNDDPLIPVPPRSSPLDPMRTVSWMIALGILSRRQKQKANPNDSIAESTTVQSRAVSSAASDQVRTEEEEASGRNSESAGDPSTFFDKILNISTSNSTSSGGEHLPEPKAMHLTRYSARSKSPIPGASFDMIDFNDVIKKTPLPKLGQSHSEENTDDSSKSASSEFGPGQSITTAEDLKLKFQSYVQMNAPFNSPLLDGNANIVSYGSTTSKCSDGEKNSITGKKWNRRKRKVIRSIKQSKARLANQIHAPFGAFKEKQDPSIEAKESSSPLHQEMKKKLGRNLHGVSAKGLVKSYRKVANEINSSVSTAKAKMSSVGARGSDGSSSQHVIAKANLRTFTKKSMTSWNHYLSKSAQRCKSGASEVMSSIQGKRLDKYEGVEEDYLFSCAPENNETISKPTAKASAGWFLSFHDSDFEPESEQHLGMKRTLVLPDGWQESQSAVPALIIADNGEIETTMQEAGVPETDDSVHAALGGIDQSRNIPTLGGILDSTESRDGHRHAKLNIFEAIDDDKSTTSKGTTLKEQIPDITTIPEPISTQNLEGDDAKNTISGVETQEQAKEEVPNVPEKTVPGSVKDDFPLEERQSEAKEVSAQPDKTERTSSSERPDFSSRPASIRLHEDADNANADIGHFHVQRSMSDSKILERFEQLKPRSTPETSDTEKEGNTTSACNEADSGARNADDLPGEAGEQSAAQLGQTLKKKTPKWRRSLKARIERSHAGYKVAAMPEPCDRSCSRKDQGHEAGDVLVPSKVNGEENPPECSDAARKTSGTKKLVTRVDISTLSNSEPRSDQTERPVNKSIKLARKAIWAGGISSSVLATNDVGVEMIARLVERTKLDEASQKATIGPDEEGDEPQSVDSDLGPPAALKDEGQHGAQHKDKIGRSFLSLRKMQFLKPRQTADVSKTSNRDEQKIQPVPPAFQDVSSSPVVMPSKQNHLLESLSGVGDPSFLEEQSTLFSSLAEEDEATAQDLIKDSFQLHEQLHDLSQLVLDLFNAAVDGEPACVEGADSYDGSTLANSTYLTLQEDGPAERGEKTRIPFLDDATDEAGSSEDDDTIVVSYTGVLNRLLAVNCHCQQGFPTVESDVSSVTTDSIDSSTALGTLEDFSGAEILVDNDPASKASSTGTKTPKSMPSEWIEFREPQAKLSNVQDTKKMKKKKVSFDVKSRLMNLVKRKRKPEKKKDVPGKIAAESKFEDATTEPAMQPIVSTATLPEASKQTKGEGTISVLSDDASSTSQNSWTMGSDVFSGVISTTESQQKYNI